MDSIAKMQGVYHRKDGRWEARYKKGIGTNGRAQYGAVYGDSEEEVIARREEMKEELNGSSNELNLLILGAGSHGHDVKEVAEALHIFHKISFLDDNVKGENIIGKCKDAPELRRKYPCAFVAIGDNQKRKEYAEYLQVNKFLIPKLISPTAVVSPTAQIGDGTVVMPQATVGAATIEGYCIIASNSIINSFSTIKAYSHIDAGGIVSKGAQLSEGAFVECGEVVR